MRISWWIVGIAALVLTPSTARAIEVMCQNETGGACTLSNDPSQMYECTCDGEFVGGTTGGSENPWEDFTEAELLDVCMDSLPAECPTGGSTTTGGSDTDVGTGPVTTTPDTNPTTDPSGPATASGPVGDSSGEASTGDDDDDDKGCSIGARDRGASPWLAVLLACAWRRRVSPVAG